MLLYRHLTDGTFLACDTEKGVADIVFASSYWARVAHRHPSAAARALTSTAKPPNPHRKAGRKLARRNGRIIAELRQYVWNEAARVVAADEDNCDYLVDRTAIQAASDLDS